MTEYLLLLGFIFAVGIFCFSNFKNENRETIFLRIVFLAIFLLCALRASSVGRDLPGYENAFLVTKKVAWNNYSYIYFESGYVFLMKVCVRLGMSFQWFISITSAITLIPLYFYIKKHSENPFLSILIYICYVFFEFNMTGIRQAIASSIVLLGFLIFLNAKKFARIKLLLFILLASTIHTGAFVCILFLPFSFIKKMPTYTCAISLFTVVAILFRKNILLLLQYAFPEDKINVQAGIYIGLNFIFIFALVIYFLATYRKKDLKCDNLHERDKLLKLTEWQIKWFMFSVPIILVLGMDTAVRSYMFFSQVIIVQLPNSLSVWKKGDRIFINAALIVFFVIFFFTNTLIPNNFDIVPYRFFWE